MNRFSPSTEERVLRRAEKRIEQIDADMHALAKAINIAVLMLWIISAALFIRIYLL